MWSVLAHLEQMLKAARGCLWWTLIVIIQMLYRNFASIYPLRRFNQREEMKLSGTLAAVAGGFTYQIQLTANIYSPDFNLSTSVQKKKIRLKNTPAGQH